MKTEVVEAEQLTSPQQTPMSQSSTFDTSRAQEQDEKSRAERHDQRLQDLWGPEPIYSPQPEDKVWWWWGSIFFTWLNHAMSAAASEELDIDDLPRPVQTARAYSAGTAMSGVMQRQRVKRHCWDALYGQPVTLDASQGGGDGLLVYVGPCVKYDQVGALYAGIVWETAPVRASASSSSINGEAGSRAGSFLTSEEWEGLGIKGAGNVALADNAIITLEPVAYVRFKQEEGGGGGEAPRKPSRFPKGLSAMRGLLTAFGPQLFRLGPLRAVTDFTTLASPVVLRAYLKYIREENRQHNADGSISYDDWLYGVGIVALFFGTAFVHSIAYHKYSQLCIRCIFTFRTALSAAVFEKCLTISSKSLARPDMSVGRIVNMLSNDVEQVEQLCRYFWLIVFLPFQLVGAMVLLYQLVGWASFSGIMLSILCTPLQALLTRRVYKCYGDLAKATDLRLKVTNEFLLGIRTAKFMSLEKMFLERIKEKRAAELKQVRRSQILWTVLSLCTDIIPDLSTALLFIVYYTTGHALTPAVIYPAMSLISITVMPIRLVPIFIHGMSSLFVSMRRLSIFLECPDSEVVQTMEELMASTDGATEDARSWRKFAASFTGATLTAYKAMPLSSSTGNSREEDNVTDNSDENNTNNHNEHSADDVFEFKPVHVLTDLTIRIPRGRLTIVVGPTGSGKSTLLRGLVGAVEVSKGSAAVEPSIAYVSEEPWVMDATLRENITFFSDLDESWFAHVVECAQLQDDLKALPEGADTQVGERGIPLSGGQQSRLALARAVYANKDVYLLDDPISSLDPVIQERIIDECLMGTLSNRTRVLATHQTSLLYRADYVVVMAEGTGVEFCGTYTEYRNYASDSTYKGRRSGFVDFSLNSLPSHGGEDGLMAAAMMTERTTPSTDAGASCSSPVSNVMLDDGKAAICTEDDALLHCPQKKSTSLADDEEKAKGGVPAAMYMRYIQACGGKTAIAVTSLVYIFTEVASVSSTVWLSFWATKKLDFWPDDYCFFMYVGLVLVGAFGLPLRYGTALAYTRRACAVLHSNLIDTVSRGTLSFFDSTPRGRIINRFSRDMGELDSALQFNLVLFLMFGLYLVSTFTIMITSQYMIILLVVPFVIVYGKILFFYCAANREIQRTNNICSSPIYSILGEAIAGRWTIAAYQKSSQVLGEALRRLDVKFSCSYLQSVSEHWLSIRVEVMSLVLLTALAALGVVSAHTDRVPVNVGLIALVISNAGTLNAVLSRFISFGAAVEASMNSVERITFYTDHTPTEKWDAAEESDGGDSDAVAVDIHDAVVCHGEGRSSAANQAHSNRSQQPPQDGLISLDNAHDEDTALELQNVGLRYRPGHPLVLQGISVCIRRGQKVGVVGRSGSGKSSLMLALVRLMEISEGSIFVHGKNARSYDMPSLRKLFAMIPQDPRLFDGTIRSNLDPTNTVPDAVLWDALGHVGLAEKMRHTPGGALNSSVREGGSNFSVGQRQLLCLARALVKPGACFLLMDEATANIDSALEDQIQQTVRRVFESFTVITIAHRLHTLVSYDVVLVLEHGKLVAVGSPADLMRSMNPFRSLVESMGAQAVRRFEAALERNSAHE